MYGTLAGVAALAKAYTIDGQFLGGGYCLQDCLDEETNPTAYEVHDWLDKLSATMNNALAGEGFVVPITASDPVKEITMIVEQYAADLCHAANHTGRFFTENAIRYGVVPIIAVRKDIIAWANENAANLAANGAARTSSPADQIGTKTNTAIFSRKGFGNRFENWTDDE